MDNNVSGVTKESSRKILDSVRKNFDPTKTYEHREVTFSDFPHLSKKFYNRSQNEVETLGFSFVADVENVSMTMSTPDPRSVIRICNNPEQTINCGIYQVKPRLFWRILMFLLGNRTTKVVEFQSELEDGTIVITTPVPDELLLPSSPQLIKNTCSPKSTISEMLSSHKEKLASLAKGINKLDTLSKLLALEKKQIKIQGEYLKSIGWITEEYLIKLGSKEDQAKAIIEHIKIILRDEMIMER